ncbi:MAG TPA: aminopeptidase, partial [Candidatus Wallbacteria bacterium]|nr:aminopeptidase [Candidatus Wallbacteria bacterium]
MGNIFEKYAKLIIHYSLKLKKGQNLLIRSTNLAEPLLREIYKEAVKVGALPEFMLGVNGVSRMFYDHASEEQLRAVSPLYKYAVENFHAILSVSAPYNLKELQTVPAEKKKAVNMAMTGVNKTFMRRSFDGTMNWSLCEFPTDAAAQECGMSRDEYADFVYSACFLYDSDPIARWTELKKNQQKWVDMLDKKDKIRFSGPDTDITFSVKGRKWINSSGDANMPSGEVFTTPIEDSVNGKIRFSYPGIFMGQEIEDISLEVKGGEVIKWDAKVGRKLLDSVFEIPGSRRFGEAAIGTNYGITKFIKNMLFDEKIGGTIHMAIGAAYP